MISRLKDSLRPYLPRNIRHTLREKKLRQFAQTCVFSTKRPVIYLNWADDGRPGRAALHEELKDRPLMLLYMFFAWITVEEVAAFSQEIKETLQRYPKHRIVMLCNEQFAAEGFRAAGVEALFCNQNCLVNENVFTIDPKAVKKYDAMYNGQMTRAKRHELAAKIESIALITYRYIGNYEASYEEDIRRCLGHAAWLVDAHNNSEKASAADVARYNNQCRVGLCLSASEGAMFGSIEYLLCGLPVVTTRNIGGRDVFFDPDYVEWVDDNPDAVRDGMARLLARAPAAQVIRDRTIARMEEHRQRLRDLLKDDVPDLQIPLKPGESIGPFTQRNLRELGRELREG